MTLCEIELQGAPPLQCRAVLSAITLAHIAGLPLQAGEEALVVSMQKLDTRVPKHFGAAPFVVLQPELASHPSGTLAAPKIERMAFLLSEDTQENHVRVWFEHEDEVFMSERNLSQTAELNWKDHAGPVRQ